MGDSIKINDKDSDYHKRVDYTLNKLTELLIEHLLIHGNGENYVNESIAIGINFLGNIIYTLAESINTDHSIEKVHENLIKDVKKGVNTFFEKTSPLAIKRFYELRGTNCEH